jgi:non-homologous end joining protein Ku
MRKYHIYLTSEERKLIIENLVSKKNTLISEGKYTDGVDDVLLKLLQAKKKKAKVIYT